jgi:hypothetical protein
VLPVKPSPIRAHRGRAVVADTAQKQIVSYPQRRPGLRLMLVPAA